MKWIVRGYALILLAYTGWRTFDFMSQQLPDTDTGFWLAVLFLFATEAGLLLWHEISIGHTTTYTQHSIAVTMTWVDFAASLGAGIADMIIRQTIATEYIIPGWLAMALIFGLPVVVAINIAAALMYAYNDAEAQTDRETRFLLFEASHQALKDLRQNRSGIARERRKEIMEAIRGTAMKQIDRQVSEPPAPIAINGKSKKEVAIKAAETVAPPTIEPNPTKAGKRKA